ncbi:hypothetical protein DCCM_0038 [Desulfocucumis palustris]|uniref:Uncharacterized protein n=1 Tax=Desulfocucumis palustris TaxID=1898651 RepID=A0A2L2X7H6_9FIRM|nr:LysO family transporter [Desulfocucumis palustris]GBF31854.1 hypothetical protein DCCM_0038 [Desulfocucumis palustris]
MGVIFISLGLGVALGFLRPLSVSQSKMMFRVTMAGLFLLLVVMGAQLGVNQEVLNNLGKIGFKAVVLAGFAVAGSILAVHILFRWLDPKGSGKKTASENRENLCQ